MNLSIVSPKDSRNVTTASLIEGIIENELSPTQKLFVKEYWYCGKNTAQIGRENNVSQATVYRTLSRASETIKKLMTPVIMYHNDLLDTQLVPIKICELMDICSAQNSQSNLLSVQLRNIRLSYAITAEHLASVLKISLKELMEIESGRRFPSITTILRYSVLFELEIKMEFVNGKGVYICKKA